MNCRLCGSSDLYLYYTQGNNDEYKYYRCKNCDLVNYDLSGGLDQGKYGEEYWSPFDLQEKQNMLQTKSYDFIKSHLSSSGKVMEIGCGNGRLLHLFKENGWQAKGLELSDVLAKGVKKTLDIDVETANFLDDDFEVNEQFDVVILRHVLEHLPDPILAMKRINMLLKNGGFGFLEFPNIQGIDLKFKRLTTKMNLHNKKYKDDYVPGHCNEYSLRSFSYLANKTGFVVDVWETYSHKPSGDILYNNIPIGNKARTIIKKVEEVY